MAASSEPMRSGRSGRGSGSGCNGTHQNDANTCTSLVEKFNNTAMLESVQTQKATPRPRKAAFANEPSLARPFSATPNIVRLASLSSLAQHHLNMLKRLHKMSNSSDLATTHQQLRLDLEVAAGIGDGGRDVN